MKNENGKKNGLRGIAGDVIEKFSAQVALLESERSYQRQYEACRSNRSVGTNLLPQNSRK